MTEALSIPWAIPAVTDDNPNTVMYNYVRNQLDLNAPLYSDEGTTYWDFATM